MLISSSLLLKDAKKIVMLFRILIIGIVIQLELSLLLLKNYNFLLS